MSPSDDNGKPGTKAFESFVPPHLKDGEEPLFAEPWQAQAFAMTIALSRQGLFTWDEWATALGGEISAGKNDDRFGGRYYEYWLAALERLVAEKGAASPDKLASLHSAWADAYRHTPHGKPVKLPTRD